MNIYVCVCVRIAAAEALRKKERQDETQFTTKIDAFLSFIPGWMLKYFFAGFYLSHPCMTKLRVMVLGFSYFMDNSIIQLLLHHRSKHYETDSMHPQLMEHSSPVGMESATRDTRIWEILMWQTKQTNKQPYPKVSFIIK